MLNRRAIEARLLEKARLEPTFRRKLKQLGLHNDVVVDTDES